MEVDTLHTCTIDHYNNYDPSRTTSLRNAFAVDAKRRFNELALVVKRAVVDDDCFGLKDIQTLQMTPPGKNAFAFGSSASKVEAFMKWLQEQVDRGILTVGQYQQLGTAINKAWTDLYILDSYKRAVMRSRYEMKKAGLDVPLIDQSGGIDVVMMNPMHIDRLGLLFSRVYSDLKGITDAMDMQISRVLAQGMADGDGMLLIARKLVSTITGAKMGELGITDTLGRFIPAMRRATLLARTEIIRAYADATLQEFENWGVEGVSAKAEFMTAGDDRVCPICHALEGQVFTIAEARGKIPVHPNCRCIWLPYIESLQKYR